MNVVIGCMRGDEKVWRGRLGEKRVEESQGEEEEIKGGEGM